MENYHSTLTSTLKVQRSTTPALDGKGCGWYKRKDVHRNFSVVILKEHKKLTY